MKLRVLVLVGGLCGFLGGCASTALDRYMKVSPAVPSSNYVEGVPSITQSRFQCGPAALAMVLNWAGKDVSEATLSEKMFTPKREGTFQSDVLGAARREGFLAIPLTGYKSLLSELAAGHPVLVFQNLGFSWYPVWHYAVVIGYDLDSKTITLHSGDKANLEMDLEDFEDTWGKASHWAVVVLPPSRLSASADEIDHLQATVHLERMGNLSAARLAYETILDRWPKSLGGWIGIANIEFAKGNTSETITALKKATEYHPQSSAAWHNLALAYAKKKQFSRAKFSARKALEKVSPSERSAYFASLKEFAE